MKINDKIKIIKLANDNDMCFEGSMDIQSPKLGDEGVIIGTEEDMFEIHLIKWHDESSALFLDEEIELV